MAGAAKNTEARDRENLRNFGPRMNKKKRQEKFHPHFQYLYAWTVHEILSHTSTFPSLVAAIDRTHMVASEPCSGQQLVIWSQEQDFKTRRQWFLQSAALAVGEHFAGIPDRACCIPPHPRFQEATAH